MSYSGHRLTLNHHSSILSPLLESKVCATGKGQEGEYDYTCGESLADFTGLVPSARLKTIVCFAMSWEGIALGKNAA